ncbi:NAD(+) diphosphatase [Cellulomonas sp. PhB143]|uniref:NAD(+) diphosphatase n=1 Tax=Cellulomonas sp. PhB143 TaxID=2485186 RepID=UPI000FC08508|nr:NAD(+) diphosphatase [Cellulomonas sp. PhB143]ROS76861.1 NAD+ diphosphatase [Cellulomonas sp. PhB143]
MSLEPFGRPSPARSGPRLDPQAHRRTEPGLVDALLAGPATRVLLVHRGRLATAGPTALARLVPATTRPPGEAADGPAADGPAAQALAALVGAGPGERGIAARLFLGRDLGTGEDLLALVLADAADAADAGIEGVVADEPAGVLVGAHEWRGLRDLSPGLGPVDAAAATTAVALAAWHARSPRCSRCGEPTDVVQAGWVRHCVVDDVDEYPRTDAAVIMTVLDADDRLLLGHAARWPAGRFSTLAGYVEPGEELEDAVRREVLEEVGVVVGDVAYRGSQSWPFPASLMLGFTAHATSTAIEVDAVEVTQARWFTRDELLAAVRAGDVGLPGRSSIARALIEDWFGGALPGA